MRQFEITKDFRVYRTGGGYKDNRLLEVLLEAQWPNVTRQEALTSAHTEQRSQEQLTKLNITEINTTLLIAVYKFRLL